MALRAALGDVIDGVCPESRMDARYSSPSFNYVLPIKDTKQLAANYKDALRGLIRPSMTLAALRTRAICSGGD